MKYDKKQLKRLYFKALKIGCGSFIAIIIAHSLGLRYEISAGTIALLSIMTTRWETLRISIYRIFSFAITLFLCWITYTYLGSNWIYYGFVIFIMVMILEMIGWASTLSINAVIAAHFLTEHDFSFSFILNEFLLVLIGTTIAVILNFFNNHKKTRKELVKYMQYTESALQTIFEEMAAYLSQKPMKRNVRSDIRHLEEDLKKYLHEAYQYQDNTFTSQAEYYIQYFEMRLEQINVLDSLHQSLCKLQSTPDHAIVIASFIHDIRASISDMNSVDKLLHRLNSIVQQEMHDHLPKNLNELEEMAILYHILMDLEDYLIIKRRFSNSLNEIL